MRVTKMFIFCGRHKFMISRLQYCPKPRSVQNFHRYVIFSNQIQNIDKSPFQYTEDVLVEIHAQMSEFEKLDKVVSFLA